MPMKDDYAREVLRAGRDLGITPRGIVIAFATVSVECDWLMYANRADRETLNYPHDRIGSDSRSAGLFQQQPPWWGTAADRMDPYRSSRMFFEALAKLDYNNTARSPGWYAQAVQRSAFPDRYDERMAEAQQLYDRLATAGGPTMPALDYGITKMMHGYNATSIGIGNSDGPRDQTLYVVIHTQEAPSTAVDLANFCNGSATSGNPVSYNVVTDDEDTIEVVPIIEAPWSAAEANGIAVHICCAGSFAGWPEGKWLSTDTSDGLNEDAMLWRTAKAAAAACQQFGIPAIFAGDGGKSGWPIKPKGICGHRDFGRRGGGHSDPGDGFPMAEFLRRVNTFLAPTPTEPEDDMAFTDDDRKKLNEVWDQLRGPGGKGWPQLGNLTPVDALAKALGLLGKIASKLGA
jgi:hypothetical protein